MSIKIGQQFTYFFLINKIILNIEKMRKLYAIILNLYILKCVLVQDLNLSLNDRLLLNQNYAGIVTISADYQPDLSFMVNFADGQLRRYNADLTSYSVISTKQTVQVWKKNYQSLWLGLSDGNFTHLEGTKITLISNNMKTLRDLDYYTYAQLHSVTFSKSILQQFGFPVGFNNIVRTAHIIFFETQFRMSFGEYFEYKKYTPTIGTNSTFASAVHYTTSIYQSTNVFMVTLNLFVGLDNKLYQMGVSFQFVYNFTSTNYDLNYTSVVYNQIYTAPTPITTLLLDQGLLMMQSNSSGITYIYDLNSFQIGTAVGIPLDQTFNFFYIFNSYYILQSKGLIKLDYDATAFQLTLNALVSALPFNTYKIVLSSLSHVFYIPGLPYIYKAGACLGQSQDIDGSCAGFNCSDANCSYCPFSTHLCSICMDGFLLDSNYSCTSIDASNKQNINLVFSIILEYLKGLLKFLISIPGARRVFTPFFYYFGIFDDILFYRFHDRVYSPTMNNVFESLSDIQSEKWSILNYSTVLNWLQINQNAFQNATDYKHAYDTFNFTDANHTDVGAEGLWANCQNFFVVALPITVFGFICGRILFKALFNFLISKLFRRFSLWPLLLLLLFDGNIQQFAFYQATDWKNMFFFSFGSKLVKVQTTVFGFVLVVSSASLYLVSFSVYLKLNRHLMDNSKNTTKGHFSLIVQLGLRNCLLGVMHSYLRALQYRHAITILVLSQLGFIICFVLFIATNVYENKIKIWVFVLLNLAKTVLVLSFVANDNEPVIELIQQTLLSLIMILFLFGVLVETILFLSELVGGIMHLLTFKVKDNIKKTIFEQSEFKLQNRQKLEQKRMLNLSKLIKLSGQTKSKVKVQTIKLIRE